jgi:hypothetical protein
LSDKEPAFGIRVEMVVPICRRDLGAKHRHIDAGVIHKDVDSTEFALRSGDAIVDLGEIRDVHFDGDYAVLKPLHRSARLIERNAGAVADRHIGAGLGQQHACGRAESGGCARHEGRFSA